MRPVASALAVLTSPVTDRRGPDSSLTWKTLQRAQWATGGATEGEAMGGDVGLGGGPQASEFLERGDKCDATAEDIQSNEVSITGRGSLRSAHGEMRPL